MNLYEFAMHARHPGIVALISDLLGGEDLQLGIEVLRGRGHDVFVLQLLAEEEIEPPLDEAMYLVDAESGAAFNVTADEQLRTLYRSHLQQRLGKFEQYCLRRGIEYLRASTAISFEDVVFNYLRRGAWSNDRTCAAFGIAGADIDSDHHLAACVAAASTDHHRIEHRVIDGGLA